MTTLDDRPTRRRDTGSAPRPRPRGTLSGWLLDHLTREPHGLPVPPAADDDPLTGEDAPLALYLLYELHYRGLEGVDERWEWDPGVLAVRRDLEAAFEQRLLEEVGMREAPDDLVGHLQALLTPGDGPSVSRWCEEHGQLWHLREQAINRSAWQLKEADPHSWALPRLWGRPKAALVEIQADEYGDGVEKDIHAELFALHMDRLGLDPTYGAYLDAIPGVTLAGVSLVSMFGLHRRWRGALVGHLAAFEMSSVPTMGRYSAALRRLGFDDWTRLFYDTHVVADAHHQTVAATDLAGGLAEQEPHLAAQIVFGVESLGFLEAALTDHVLGRWERGESSLRVPLPGDLPPPPGLREETVPADDPRDA